MPFPSSAILINAAKQRVSAVAFTNRSGEIQELVGGWIEVALQYPNGDTLYVDEEGLLKAQRNFFRIPERADQPFAGNGLIVGKEILDDEGDYLGSAPPTSTVEEICAAVQFRTREQFDAWGKANASEPASSITTWDATGKPTTRVTGRFGTVVANVPQVDEGQS